MQERWRQTIISHARMVVRKGETHPFNLWWAFLVAACGGGDDVFSYSNARYKIGDFNGQGEDRLDVGTNKLIWWQRLYNKDTIVVGNHETVNGYRSRKIMFELAGYTDEIDQDDFLVTDTNFIFFEVV